MDDLYWVIDLQKSDYSDKFYINIGIYVKAIEDIKNPKSYKCHTVVRITSISNDYMRDLLEKSLDCEFIIKDEDRVKTLRDAFNIVVFPFLENFTSIPAIYQTITEEKIPNIYPRTSLINFLSEWKASGTLIV